MDLCVLMQTEDGNGNDNEDITGRRTGHDLDVPAVWLFRLFCWPIVIDLLSEICAHDKLFLAAFQSSAT